jgi:hypothetical protein
MAAEPVINPNQINQSKPFDGVVFSGSPPTITDGALYSDLGILMFDGFPVGVNGTINITQNPGMAPVGCQIYLDGSDTVLVAANGTEILSSPNAGGVINYALNHSFHSLYIHSGNYSITESIDLRTRACHIYGSGKNTILYGSINPIVNIFNTGSYWGDVSLSNIHIKGAGNKQYDGVRVGRVALNNKLMDNVWISNCKDALWIGDTSFGNDYYSVDISDCYRGIKINSTSLVTTQRFFGGSVRVCTQSGVRLENSAVGNLFNGMIIEYNGNNSIPNAYIYMTTAPYIPYGNIFRECWFEDDTFLFAINGETSWISPRLNIIENCHFVAMANNTMAFRVMAGRSNVFKGNILDPYGHNATIELLSDAVNNTIVENLDDGTAEWMINDQGINTTIANNYWG